MIIIRLSGGLGNQMFQYAFGRALSLRRGAELALDLSSFGSRAPGEPERGFALDRFDIHAKIATDADFARIGAPHPTSLSPANMAKKALAKALDSNRPIPRKKVVLERSFAYDPGIMEAGDGSYLSGVWQSERYFRDVAEIIRGDFKLKEWSKLALALRKQMEKAAAGTPVSVHVRRGDYASDPKTARKHGALPVSYYEKALETIAGRVPNPVFYIFSDDPAWCAEHLSFMKPFAVVSGPELALPEEVALMSVATHHVIANSSFSWWGAWLDADPAKTVIAPREWFKTSTETKDLLPEGWIKI